MISTKDYTLLPNRISLVKICKAISVIEAIISQDWEFRYYSFNSKWDIGEQCLQMRNGEGDEMHILFKDNGCVINGFAHEFNQADKTELIEKMPLDFEEFILGEPINSIGTTFCIWSTNSDNWHTGIIKNFDDNSKEMLNIFNKNPKTYIDWALDYHEISSIPINVAQKIYDGQVLTREMVLSINKDIEDWNQLKDDLIEIDYSFDFEDESKLKKKWRFW